VDAPVEAVRGVLLDYAHLGRLNPAIRSSELLAAPVADVERVRTVIEACALMFCRTLVRVEDVRRLAGGSLRADIVPVGSDFSAGTSYWFFESEAGGTRLRYHASLQPDFWVPPLLGPTLITRSMREEFLLLFENLEAEARLRADSR
jgi:hypothetical protein